MTQHALEMMSKAFAIFWLVGFAVWMFRLGIDQYNRSKKKFF